MFLKAPVASIDWSNVGLQGFDQTSHAECTWSSDTLVGGWRGVKYVDTTPILPTGICTDLWSQVKWGESSPLTKYWEWAQRRCCYPYQVSPGNLPMKGFSSVEMVTDQARTV